MEMSLLGRNTAEYGESNGDPDDFTAMVKKGWSWKRRLMCLTYFLGGNLFLGFIVCLIIYLSGSGGTIIRRLGFGKNLQVARCSKITAEYSRNATTDKSNIYITGPLQIIPRPKNKGWFILVPYGSYSTPDYAVSGGVLAFYSDTMQKSWDYTAKSIGVISSFKCSEDLDKDGVPDCALVTANPASVEILSGADGTQITVWYPEGPWSFFPPQWIPDMNGDGVAELFLTSEKERRNGRETDLVFTVLYSRREKTKTLFTRYEDVFTFTNSTTSSPAVRLKIGEGKSLIGPIGKFADLDCDGAPELLACDQSGDLVALSLVTRSVLWTFSYPGFKCHNLSIFFGRFNDDSTTDVGTVFKSEKESSIVLLDGGTGKRLEGKKVSLVPVDHTVPLTLKLERSEDGRAEDVFLYWRHHQGTIQIVAQAPFSMNSTLISEQYVYKTEDSDSLTTREAVEILDMRYSGAFLSNEKRVEYFFATNFFYSEDDTWRLLLHRIYINCTCTEPACEKKFADSQPWSMEQESLENSCRA